MRNKFHFLSLCAVLTLSACEKVVVDEEPMAVGQQQGAPFLSVTTRTGDASGSDDSSASAVSDGRVFVFNQSGKCVQVLSMDDSNSTASTQLDAGTYTLCAIGGNDLARFSLPLQGSASLASVVTLKSDKTMDDLLMAVKEVALTDEDVDKELVLERKIISINKVEIKGIPTEAKGVSVSVGPFYEGVCLNGTFPDSGSGTCTIVLTRQDDGTTWSAQPKLLTFPSKGVPTVKVAITAADGVEDVYAYTAAETMAANRHYNISGTFSYSQGIKLSATMTARNWAADQNLMFDFDKSGLVYEPVLGQKCSGGYYVVGLDEAAHTAVLMAKANLTYEAPADDAEPAEWRQALTGPMAALELPTNVSGAWRLPTSAEIAVLTSNAQMVNYDSETGASRSYFCEENGELMWAQAIKKDGEITHTKGTSGFKNWVRLRPVIDISMP